MDTVSFLTLVSSTPIKDIMDPTTIIMTLAGTIQLGALWWMKQTWDNHKAFTIEMKAEHQRLETEARANNDRTAKHLNDVFNHLNEFRVHVATMYTPKSDLAEIKEILHEIQRDMKAKADK